MTSTFLAAPPQTLTQWLRRSISWTAVCVLPCAGLGYLVIVKANAVCHSCGTSALLTPLAMGMVLGSNLFFRRAFVGFTALFQPAQWRNWHKAIALSWFLVLILTLVCWLLLNAIVVLMMLFSWFDDGRSQGF